MNQQELHIKETLPALSFNYDQLKEWAHGLTARYADMVVTEDAVADVKRDMAELNKNKAKLETARKETVSRLSEPLRAFETQIKEICAIFDETYSRLGSQVKAFEDAQREEKRQTVAGLIIEANMNAFGEPERLTIPVQEKWLNKTTTLKAIREDLASIVQRHIEEEQRKAALEQARQDRIASIESHVHFLNERHGFEFSVSSFVVGQFMNMDTPLAEVLKRVESAFKDEQARRDLQANTAACSSQPEDKSACVSESAKSERQTQPAQPRVMSIIIEYDAANEAQIKACLENLKPLCAKFGARYR